MPDRGKKTSNLNGKTKNKNDEKSKSNEHFSFGNILNATTVGSVRCEG